MVENARPEEKPEGEQQVNIFIQELINLFLIKFDVGFLNCYQKYWFGQVSVWHQFVHWEPFLRSFERRKNYRFHFF